MAGQGRAAFLLSQEACKAASQEASKFAPKGSELLRIGPLTKGARGSYVFGVEQPNGWSSGIGSRGALRRGHRTTLILLVLQTTSVDRAVGTAVEGLGRETSPGCRQAR